MKRISLKHICCLAALCLSMAWTSAYAQNGTTDWAQLNKYAQANKELAAPAAGEKRVVFMGNSITEFWVTQDPDFFSQNGYIGRGISGQTSYQFVVRFRPDVINLKPDLVVLNVGTNDAAENTGPFDADITMGNIISMVELAQANNIKIILTSVLPASQFPWRKSITDAADRISKLNTMIEAYAKEHNLPFVNYYEKMVSGPEHSLNPAYTVDGVHPNKDGYKVMEAIIKPAIEKEL